MCLWRCPSAPVSMNSRNVFSPFTLLLRPVLVRGYSFGSRESIYACVHGSLRRSFVSVVPPVALKVPVVSIKQKNTWPFSDLSNRLLGSAALHQAKAGVYFAQVLSVFDTNCVFGHALSLFKMTARFFFCMFFWRKNPPECAFKVCVHFGVLRSNMRNGKQ